MRSRPAVVALNALAGWPRWPRRRRCSRSAAVSALRCRPRRGRAPRSTPAEGTTAAVPSPTRASRGGAPLRSIGACPSAPRSPPRSPGATHVTAVVPVSDGGAVVSGSFTGTVSFAADKTLVDDGSSSGFVARFRRDQRLVWVTQLHGDRVTVSDLAGVGNDEVVASGWFAGTLRIDQLGGRLDHGPEPRWPRRLRRPPRRRRQRALAHPLGWSRRRHRARGRGARLGDGRIGARRVHGRGGRRGRVRRRRRRRRVHRRRGRARSTWRASMATARSCPCSYAGAGIPGQGYGVAIDGARRHRGDRLRQRTGVVRNLAVGRAGDGRPRRRPRVRRALGRERAARMGVAARRIRTGRGTRSRSPRAARSSPAVSSRIRPPSAVARRRLASPPTPPEARGRTSSRSMSRARRCGRAGWPASA